VRSTANMVPEAGDLTSSISTRNGPDQPALPSSSWCCNPQFQMTVKRGGEVVVALGQQDPRLEAGGHVRKQDRKRRIGFVVGGLQGRIR
jgi:hypothetical protein